MGREVRSPHEADSVKTIASSMLRRGNTEQPEIVLRLQSDGRFELMVGNDPLAAMTWNSENTMLTFIAAAMEMIVDNRKIKGQSNGCEHMG